MPGIRYPCLDLSYYLNDPAAIKSAGTRLLNWAEQSGVTYILFQLEDECLQGCSDVLLFTSECRVFDNAYLLRSGQVDSKNAIYVDLTENLWLLRARYEEESARFASASTVWFVLNVREDTLSLLSADFIDQMQNAMNSSTTT